MNSLLLGWDETGSCAQVQILVVEVSCNFPSEVSFMWVSPRGWCRLTLSLLLPSPHKQPKTPHKAPPPTLSPSFRTKKSSCLKEQAQDDVALIELPRQRFLRPFKTPSRRHQTAFYFQTQMAMEGSPE